MTINKNLVEKLFKNTEDGGRFLDLNEMINVKRIPTISPSVNYMLQGGIVPSKFYAFAGPPSSGKSMFAVSCCADMLRNDPDAIVIWFDVEKSFTKHWLDIYLPDFTEDELRTRFIVKECESGKQIFDYFATDVMDMIQSGQKVAACVVDSVQSIIPPAEAMTEDSEKMTMAALARYLPQGLKRIITPSRMNNVTWFFISQVRDNMDMFTQMTQKYVITGGKGFHHHIDGIIMFEPINRKDMRIYSSEKGIGGKEIQIGHYVQAKMQNKCRVGVPNRTARFKFLYKEGIIDTHEEIAEMALNKSIIQTKGSFYYFGEEKIANGKAGLYEALSTTPELSQSVLLKIQESL